MDKNETAIIKDDKNELKKPNLSLKEISKLIP